MGESMDENKSEKVWNRYIIEELVSKLSSDLDNLVHVTEPAAVTKKNLALTAGREIKFIFRLLHSNRKAWLRNRRGPAGTGKSEAF